MQYPIVTDYVKSWTPLEAARELISNCLDGKGEVAFEEGVLVLTNKNTKLDKQCLLLGHSDKQANSIGQYGEGMKLAALVLCRDGLEFSFQNANEMWQWKLKHSKMLGAKVLQMHTKKCQGTDVIIKIHGLDEAKVRGRCLALQPAEIIHSSSYGEILDLPEQGHIYVGGQWVYQSDCKLNYNLPVGKVKMNRDRGMLDSFYLKWHLRDMLAQVILTDLREEMMASDEEDIAGFEARPIELTEDFGAWLGGTYTGSRFSGYGSVRGRAVVACAAPKKINVNIRLRKFLESYKDDMTPAMLESFNLTFKPELK